MKPLKKRYESLSPIRKPSRKESTRHISPNLSTQSDVTDTEIVEKRSSKQRTVSRNSIRKVEDKKMLDYTDNSVSYFCILFSKRSSYISNDKN